MRYSPAPPPPRPVSVTGSKEGEILAGLGLSNHGLRLRALKNQDASPGGPIQGQFEILDAGQNPHAPFLQVLIGQRTDAAEVLRVIRREHPHCVSIVNANLLVIEGPEA